MSSEPRRDLFYLFFLFGTACAGQGQEHPLSDPLAYRDLFYLFFLFGTCSRNRSGCDLFPCSLSLRENREQEHPLC